MLGANLLRVAVVSTDKESVRFLAYSWFALVLASVLLLFALPVQGDQDPQTEQGASTQTADSDYLPVDNPGSIIEELEEDAAPKEYLFQFPGANNLFKPWYDYKARLSAEHGVQFGIALTHLHQWVDETVSPDAEDDAGAYDLNFDLVWVFRGRGTETPTTLGFAALYRDTAGTDIAPLILFTQAGSLYSSAAAYTEKELSLSELWLQHNFGNGFQVRGGQVFPITAYDFFPFKNFRTDFLDFNHVVNATIPLPDYGLGGFATYRPKRNMYFRLGTHDANADVEQSGFDTYDGELFTIFEAGFDPGITPQVPGRPPAGDIHLSIWHQDEREEEAVDDGWGASITALQRFGRVTPYIRFGYADVEIDGPTSVAEMFNIGVVFHEVFGQSNDRLGLGYTWSDPVDESLGDQSAIDFYYRIHVTPEIAISPTLQLVFDPVRNPEEDEVWFTGIRTRIEF